MQKRKDEIIELMTADWAAQTFQELAKQVYQSPKDISILLELNEHPQHKIAWRSAYLLDLSHDLDKTILDEHLQLLMDRTPLLSSQSIKRHYLRILSQHDLSEVADGQLLDCCFEWLQTEETPIAVKAHCMQILYDLTVPYPELISELKAVLENLIPYGSKGEVNKAKKILAQLNKTKRA
ncbi:hypothetical protein [Carboxylicivirga sp. M1479]|uniref:hypothetical protein n=1 Tax=Carboxylicivirga sp. M1479 TaxID=2594476 RepID=UPI001177B6F3|nr:hypothetical protein [Carboxylicivirga sp. M1479]TRX61161.1 hypothetical protein FNN09_20395 [Carboxylicivirga sp. M1479]